MRNVLVTGGGKRIGRAIAERLAADNWNVIVHYNGSHQDALSTVAAIEAHGGQAITLKADLQYEAEVVRLGIKAAEAFGGLSAIVNNASVFVRDDVETGTKELWDLHMAVHVRAPFVLAQGLLNQLPKGNDGAIVNIVDQRVLNPSRHFTSYTLSKMALWDQTQVLARTLAPKVRVNAIGPGPVLPSTRQSQKDFDIQVRQTPLAKIVDPSEIASAAAFLLDAGSVTGQMIAVDAGQHLNWAHETAESAPRE